MPTIQELKSSLRLPVVGAPMFIVSTPELVIAQCTAGIVGAFPSLNARPAEALDEWLTRIDTALAEARAARPDEPIAPYAVNLIVHHTNDRLEHDLEACVRHRVPVVITSLREPSVVVDAVHGYGGLVLHDVTTLRHARKAIAAGVDGLILVCAGAGGHAGMLSPFALLQEVRAEFDGLLLLAGAIAHGEAVLAAEVMGADLAYVGTRFIATAEANAPDTYKRMLVEGAAEDIVYTSTFTGVPGNYLAPSIRAAGLDPDRLPGADKSAMNFADAGSALKDSKAWRDIWGAGQGLGAIRDVTPAGDVVATLDAEYRAARGAWRDRLAGDTVETARTRRA